MSSYEPKRRAEQSRVRKVTKRVVVVVLALVLVATGTTVYLYRHLEGNITSLDVKSELGTRPTKVPVKGKQKPLNVLVMGSDTRKGKGNHVAGVTPGLSDTTILLHLSKDRSRAYGVSIPRDAMVQRPTCKRKDGNGSDPGGLTQFNAAYAIGGPACTIRTVEHLTGIYVDHFVVVDFNGFKKMVDALGGVQVCVPEEVNDTHGHIHLNAGTYKVTGQQALDYVRVRNQISANGDIGRMKRQQTFIAAMIKKAVSKGTLVNPVKLLRFLNAATSSLTTDPGFAHLRSLVSLGSSLKDIGLDKVTFITAPWQPYPPDTNRVELAPQAKALWSQIRRDKALGSRFSAEAVRASDTTPGAKVSAVERAAQTAASVGSGQLGDSSTGGTGTTDQEHVATAEANGLCV